MIVLYYNIFNHRSRISWIRLHCTIMPAMMLLYF